MSTSLPYFKALADETRMRLLAVLYRYELSVNELVSILDMGQSRISRHLKILTEAGLLQWRRDGLWVFYTAVITGEGCDFIKSVSPFLYTESYIQEDLRAAVLCIEERVLKTRQFFNAIAEDWDVLNHKILGKFDLSAAVCAAMPKACQLAVDLGCGTGFVLEKMLPSARGVVGVDGSPRMLELARRRFSPKHMAGKDACVSLRIGELEHLPLRDTEADFACINFVLHHLSSPGDTVREVGRVLRPGGRLFLADFDKHNQESMREEFGDRWLGFSEDTLMRFVHEANFTIVRIQRERVERDLQLLLVVAEK